MPDLASAGHTIGMPDRYRAAIDVEFLIVDTEFIAAVNSLSGEGLVNFP
jgi:hypothetical protein